MKTDLKDLVKQALKITKPKKDDLIIDIGSNDCTMLKFYPKKFKLVGFEPAQNIKFINKRKKIKVINSYFDYKIFIKNFPNCNSKLITSCAMFYDLENPKKFVIDIEKILENDGVWCCQISYLDSMIKNNNFYDICHEHLSYYSIETFEYLINQFNLKLFYAEINDVNGGSIRLYVCKKNCNKYDKKIYSKKLKILKLKEKKLKLDNSKTYINFEKKINTLKLKTLTFVDNILNSKKTILGLGASTKGNIVLQHFGLHKKKSPILVREIKTKSV